jgi:EmrB/QacA subfamily drug resistance transporter
MPETPAGADPRRWLALIYISIAQLMVILDASVMNIALPSAQHTLHFSDASRQWVITAYGLAFGGLLLLGGRVGDSIGRKKTFVIGLIGFAGASALGGAAVNTAMLLSARALQGVFGALLAPAALALVSLAFTDQRERAKAFGIFGAIATAGGAIGLLLGGTLTQYLSWRWALLVNIPIAAIGIIGALTVVHDPADSRNRARMDIPGVILASVGLVALVYGFTAAENDGWGAGVTIAMFVLAAVLLISFITLEARLSAPLLPLRVVTERNRGGAYLSVGLAVVSMFGMFLFLSYHLQLVMGYSPVKAGVAVLPLAAAQAFGSMQVGARLTPHIPPRLLMGAGYLVSGVGVALLALLHADSSFAMVAVAEVITGVGIGTAFMPAMSIATHGVDPQDMGIASAMVSTSQQVGGSIGTALLNTIAASATGTYLATHASTVSQRVALVHGFSIAYWWAVGFLAVATAISLIAVNAARPKHEAIAAPAGDGSEEIAEVAA